MIWDASKSHETARLETRCKETGSERFRCMVT